MARRTVPKRWPTGLIEVAPNVFGYVQGSGVTGVSNGGLIVGDDAAIAIDALFVPSMTKRYLRAIRRAGLQPGSLDIGVQVVGWAHDLTLDAGVAIVETARGVIQPLAVAVIVNVFLRRFEQRRLRRQEQVETERHEDIAKRLERLERLANQTHVVVSRRPERIEGLGPSDRRRLIEDVARQFNADPVRVEAAVSATEAMERSVGVIRASGGGLIVAEQAEETVEVKAR